MRKTFLFLLFLPISNLFAQALEPRLYTNVPTDVNFLVAGYTYSQGALPSNSLLVDPKLQINAAILAYARGLNILSHSAKIDFIMPTACIDGTAIFAGEPASRNVCGLGDLKARFAFMLLGAPATKAKNYAAYKQGTILGTSLQITAPTGQYDTEKLVNVGANRWALKVGAGVSQKVDAFLLELSVDAEYYTENSQFIGKKRQQDIIYATQVHLIYTLPKGIWFGVDTNYYLGGENTEDGVKLNDALNNSRYGATLSFPLSRTTSIKINASSGIFTRAGSNFDTLGFFLQYSFIDKD